MKKILLLLIVSNLTIAQSPCVGGFAGTYPCFGIDLQSHISLQTMDGNSGNDSWGWTDPLDGKEYAIMCMDNGTAFIDISNPTAPVFLGKLPTHTNPSVWRDAKTYNNFVFIVSEASGHGMQVFDLTRLRNVSNPPQIFTADAHYDGFGNAHNIAINETNGYAYAVGTSQFNGGLYIVDIQNPLKPTFVNGYADGGYTHDAQIVYYNGPDTEHVGKEICIGSNANQVVILDVSDKTNIIPISSLDYTSLGYTHQGWFTENQRYFILGDELDEINFGFNTRTIVFDFSDLDNPVESFNYEGTTAAIDHNGYTRGNKFYLANYTAGLRVLDITDIVNGNMTEVAHFDTYPQNNNVSFDGAWSVYPYFASGNIIISDINTGFYLVKDPTLNSSTFELDGYTLYPNPASNLIYLTSKSETINNITVTNVFGQKIMEISNHTNEKSIDISHLTSGMYLMRVNNQTTLKFIKK